MPRGCGRSPHGHQGIQRSEHAVDDRRNESLGSGVFGFGEYSNPFRQEEVVMRKFWAVSLPVSALLVWTLSAGPARVYGQESRPSAPPEAAVSFPGARLGQAPEAGGAKKGEEEEKTQEGNEAP